MKARTKKGLTNAEISKISDVHPSQVGRICGGNFKTFSHNVVQVCNALDVSVPSLEPDLSGLAPEWAQAHVSMRKLWDETPEGAKAIIRMLNAIADVNSAKES